MRPEKRVSWAVIDLGAGMGDAGAVLPEGEERERHEPINKGYQLSGAEIKAWRQGSQSLSSLCPLSLT